MLQLAGDGLEIALEVGIPEAAQLAESGIGLLGERGWAGDDELAEQLEAAPGCTRTSPDLQPLTVDVEQLSMILEPGLGEEGGVIDPQSGEVWSSAPMEHARETEEDPPDFEDPERWLYVGPGGSNDGYRDMEDFIATVSDRARADRLVTAIDGRGAFRRFKDTLARWPDEQRRWYRFSDERCRGRARRWLAAPASGPPHRPDP